MSSCVKISLHKNSVLLWCYSDVLVCVSRLAKGVDYLRFSVRDIHPIRLPWPAVRWPMTCPLPSVAARNTIRDTDPQRLCVSHLPLTGADRSIGHNTSLELGERHIELSRADRLIRNVSLGTHCTAGTRNRSVPGKPFRIRRSHELFHVHCTAGTRNRSVPEKPFRNRQSHELLRVHCTAVLMKCMGCYLVWVRLIKEKASRSGKLQLAG